MIIDSQIVDLKELFLTFSEKLAKNEKFQVIMSKLEQLSKDVTFDWIDSVLIKVNTTQFSLNKFIFCWMYGFCHDAVCYDVNYQ